MIRTLTKYIKFMGCIFLILSLVAPSYAALSMSDGSSFVTKSEFDSALADFNSRLTSFEAGINSKIDSQVSSYLDRNGIWNGARQTLINDTIYINVLDMFNVSETDRIDYTGFTTTGPGGVWTYQSWEEMKANSWIADRDEGTYSGYVAYRPDQADTGVWFAEYHLSKNSGSTPASSYCFPHDLFVANKSGLVFATLHQSKQETTYLQYITTPKYSGTTSVYADHTDSVDLGYVFVVNGVYKVRKSLWSLTASGNDFYSPSVINNRFLGGYNVVSHDGGTKAYTVPVSRYDATDNFFVKAGDRVQFAPSPVITVTNSNHKNYIASWAPKYTVPTNAAGTWPSACRWEFSFPDVTIY